jgi:hypothetical protein
MAASALILVALLAHVVYRVQSRGQSSASDREFPYVFGHDDLAARLKQHSAAHYAGLYNVMKGVTLGSVGVGLGAIVVNSVPPGRLTLFGVAFLAVVITYNGASVGQTVVHLSPSLIDVVLPMALTVAELAIVGIPGFDRSTALIPDSWLFALATWHFLAAAVVASIAYRLNASHYAPSIWRAVDRYRRRMRFDVKVATAGGIGTLAYWALREIGAVPSTAGADYVFLGLVIWSFSGALNHHGATRRELRRGLMASGERSATRA